MFISAMGSNAHLTHETLKRVSLDFLDEVCYNMDIELYGSSTLIFWMPKEG